MSFDTNYLESFDGRKTQYYSRFARNTIIISYQIEKYQTKRSNSKNDDIKFQKHLISKLKESNKKCFRKNVAIEFYFQINQKNPPAVQSLLKHYIDLIQKPLKDLNTKRKYLLIKDDSQIKALSVHYWNIEESKSQEITIILKPIRDFIFNLEFARDLEFESFPDRKMLSKFQDDETCESNNRLDRLIEGRTNSSQLFKSVKIEIDGKEIDFEKYWNQNYEEDINQEVLKIHSKLSPSSVLALMTEPKIIQIKNSKLNFSYNKMGRATALSGWFNINLGSVPVNNGESKIFKNRISVELKKWKNTNGNKLPVNPAIALKFFYEKPNKVEHDLDNLLRYVLPHFDNLINRDRYLKNINSIEIFQIHTISENTESGNLYLRIEDLSNNNMFHIVESLLEKYEY